MVIARAERKARWAAGRLDETVDAAIDAGADRLHEVVLAQVGEPVQQDLAAQAADETGQVSELTRQQVELAVTAAALRDEKFALLVAELVEQVRAGERKAGTQVLAEVVFTGDVTATANDQGTAIGQAGTVTIGTVGGSAQDPR